MCSPSTPSAPPPPKAPRKAAQFAGAASPNDYYLTQNTNGVFQRSLDRGRSAFRLTRGPTPSAIERPDTATPLPALGGEYLTQTQANTLIDQRVQAGIADYKAKNKKQPLAINNGQDSSGARESVAVGVNY